MKKVKKVLIGIEVNNNAGRCVLGGILKFVSGSGRWNVSLMSCPETLTARTVRSARFADVDGIIVNHLRNDETARALRDIDVPVSAVDLYNPILAERRRRIAFVGNDNLKIGAWGARKLLSLGRFRSFAFVPYRETAPWSDDRMRGFVEELRRHGRRNVTILDGDDVRALEKLPRPAAVMTAWDYKAVQVLEKARELNLKVPQDIAVIGVDADPLICSFTNPSLTSVAPDFERLGYCAAAALDAMMDGRKLEKPQVVRCRPKEIIERDSTRSLPPVEALLQRAKEIIARDAEHGLTVRDLALRLGVSQQLLALRFRQFESRSVRETILAAKLERVRACLRETDRNFAAVAKACGFRSANRLAHLFRERFGLSMRDYARHAAGVTSKGTNGPAY